MSLLETVSRLTDCATAKANTSSTPKRLAGKTLSLYLESNGVLKGRNRPVNDDEQQKNIDLTEIS